MAKLLLLICILKVYLCIAENTETTTDQTSLVSSYKIEDLAEYDEPRDPKYAIFSDGPPPLKFGKSEALCHQKTYICFHNKTRTAETPVCTHVKKYGLVSFTSDCLVELKNCLLTIRNKEPGNKDPKELFYYNHQGKDCQYYIKQAPTIENAVILYKLHGNVRRHFKRYK